MRRGATARAVALLLASVAPGLASLGDGYGGGPTPRAGWRRVAQVPQDPLLRLTHETITADGGWVPPGTRAGRGAWVVTHRAASAADEKRRAVFCNLTAAGSNHSCYACEATGRALGGQSEFGPKGCERCRPSSGEGGRGIPRVRAAERAWPASPTRRWLSEPTPWWQGLATTDEGGTNQTGNTAMDFYIAAAEAVPNLYLGLAMCFFGGKAETLLFVMQARARATPRGRRRCLLFFHTRHDYTR